MGFFNPFVGSGSGGGGSGKDGVGIQSIEFLSSTGGETSGIEGATDTYQINYTNGTTTTFIVKNGNKGSQGEDGEQGVSISNILVNDNGSLIITLSNGTVVDAGVVKGADGTSVNIIDNLSSSDDLPDSDQTIGDSYLIQGDLWVYTNSDDPESINGFINAGNIQGPAGVGIATILINEDDELVIVYTNDEMVNLGSVRGPTGEKGADGKSAYQVWISEGNTGTVSDYLGSLKGDTGDSAYETWVSEGNTGSEADFITSLKGESAYKIWLDEGNEGSEQDFLDSLIGEDGADGLSAYQAWLNAGNTGTISDFLNSLIGADGKSAYEVAVENGFTGTEAEWIASLKGNKGDKGEDGYTPVKGTDYLTPADIESLDIANKVDKVEGKSLIDDAEIERLSTVTNYDDSSKFNDDILKPTSLPFIGGDSLGWAYGTAGDSLASTTIIHPNMTENHPTLEYTREELLEDSEEVFFRRGYGVTGYIGNTYTFSVSLYTEDNTSIDSSGILIQLKGKQSNAWDYTEDVIVKNITSENLPNNKWTTFSITLKITEEASYVDAIVSVTRNAKFFIAQYKVQEGEVATGFYPPPPIVVNSAFSGLMSPRLYTEHNKLVNTLKYSFIATNGNKLDPDYRDSIVDFVAGENIILTVGYNDTLEADTITIDADISSKADKSYVDSLIGEGGKSAYEVAVENGFTGTEAEWIASLKGEDGDNGSDGKSAYEIAVQNGFIGTEEEWLESLKGEEGHNIVSVTELPENPEPNTWYAIREVT